MTIFLFFLFAAEDPWKFLRQCMLFVDICLTLDLRWLWIVNFSWPARRYGPWVTTKNISTLRSTSVKCLAPVQPCADPCSFAMVPIYFYMLHGRMEAKYPTKTELLRKPHCGEVALCESATQLYHKIVAFIRLMVQSPWPRILSVLMISGATVRSVILRRVTKADTLWLCQWENNARAEGMLEAISNKEPRWIYTTRNTLF